ncbi:hypothetical protein [Dactylosporangium darangshiense]|uniref:hypothetical protein n=1 Tax=Dactylosporangium darangshiense TaxID=579108 RepID=UPI0031EFC5E6
MQQTELDQQQEYGADTPTGEVMPEMISPARKAGKPGLPTGHDGQGWPLTDGPVIAGPTMIE